jgi:hypothetical protein
MTSDLISTHFFDGYLEQGGVLRFIRSRQRLGGPLSDVESSQKRRGHVLCFRHPAPIGTQASAMNQFMQQSLGLNDDRYSEEHGAQSASFESGQSHPANSVAACQLTREDQDFLRSLDNGFLLANVESSFVLSSDRTSLPSLQWGIRILRAVCRLIDKPRTCLTQSRGSPSCNHQQDLS